MNYGEFISSFLVDLQRLFRSSISLQNATYSQVLAIISIPYDGIDNDENGYIDDIHGWNFLGEVEKENLELTRKYRRCMNDGLLEGESRQDCFRVEKEFNKKHKKALQNFNYVSTYSNYFTFLI